MTDEGSPESRPESGPESGPVLPAVSMVTLGVDDLVASTRFYEALGWVNSTDSQEKVRFLVGRNIVLGLFGRADLAKDAGVAADDGTIGFSGVALAANQSSREAVDDFFNRAVLAGAKVTKRPKEVFWGGYSGYFADLDGHLWEVAHNPFVGFTDVGALDVGVPSEGTTN